MQSLLSQLRFLASVGDYCSFVVGSFLSTLCRFPRWSLIRDQLYLAGVLSLNVITLTGMSTGLVLAAQTYYQLYDKGLSNITGLLVAKAMLTELGPVLTAFMFVGRVGAAMCAELATMKVTEQIDAMITLAVDPKRQLVGPRLISASIMFPLLTVYSVIMGIFGGYLIAVYYFGMSPTTFWDPIPHYVRPFDFWMGFTKSVVFGILIVTICCHRGMRTEGGAAEVGFATTKAVVTSYIIILIVNFFLTLLLNNIHDKLTGVMW